MTYFSADFFRFFEQLSQNNTQEWFDDNRNFYDDAVKRPFKDLVQDVIERIRTQHDPQFCLPISDVVFRLNKDIRFSRDKTPFHTFVSANISHAGKKSKECPGFFFRFGCDKIIMGGGSFELDKENLTRVRHHIEDEMDRFNAIVEDGNFIDKYGELKGDRNKIVPKDLRELYEEQPLIANKQFYYEAETDTSPLLRDDLPDMLLEYYCAGKPLNDFLKEAIR